MMLFIFFLWCFWGCAANTEGAENLLRTEMKGKQLPAGEVYLSGREAGEDGFFSPQMMRAMYGEKAEGFYFPLIEEYAIYLSSAPMPVEIAVFRCFAASDALSVGEMCLVRLEQIRIATRGTEFFALAERGYVEIRGKYVVLSMV